MELTALAGNRFELSVDGLEWDALRIPVTRTNTRSYPRGHPRHGWPKWPIAESTGRHAVLAVIEVARDNETYPLSAVTLVFERSTIPGLVEVLRQNRKVEWHLPLVPRELVAQMIAAIEAFDEGRPVVPVELARITREWDARQDAQWGRETWSVWDSGMTRRRARVVAFVLTTLRVGAFQAIDPREGWLGHLDYTTSQRLRAALEESAPQVVTDYGDGSPTLIDPAQARAEMRELLDLDDFLGHARRPEAGDFS